MIRGNTTAGCGTNAELTVGRKVLGVGRGCYVAGSCLTSTHQTLKTDTNIVDTEQTKTGIRQIQTNKTYKSNKPNIQILRMYIAEETM